jgi:prophage maintenance system killer protein
MEKENWINEILNSTNGITKVAPDNRLFSKIQNRIQNKVSAQTLWLSAASIAILVALNISVIIGNKSKKENTMEVALSNSLNKSNQLY